MRRHKTTEQILTQMVDRLQKENETLKARVIKMKESNATMVDGYLDMLNRREEVIEKFRACAGKNKARVAELETEKLTAQQCTPELQERIQELEERNSELTDAAQT